MGNFHLCLERNRGKIVNILEGLELHTVVFSAAEQRKIVGFVYLLQKMGKRGQLKAVFYVLSIEAWWLYTRRKERRQL